MARAIRGWPGSAYGPEQKPQPNCYARPWFEAAGIIDYLCHVLKSVGVIADSSASSTGRTVRLGCAVHQESVSKEVPNAGGDVQRAAPEHPRVHVAGLARDRLSDSGADGAAG